MSSEKPFLLKADEIAKNEITFSHPLNPNSLISGTQLSKLTGLKRTGVSLAKIPPGKESFIYHSHHCEEEWVYIISGKGIAEIDDREYEVNAGDFIGFPTPSVAHHLRNPYEENLVYLMGGENLDVEIADFPRLGKRMIRRGNDLQVYNIADGRGLFEPEKE
ncbi:MAG: cupin domain-containing protein [Prochloraceae cyanobacterium]|nr:cupin domain-containing protein [Prochloraceae cyanobacterium]